MPRISILIFLLLAAVHFSAGRLDVMDIDASQYAEISREMAEGGSWLHVYDRGGDYLDKPPMLFWMSACSIKIFGANNFAYRLPSFLLAILAVWASFKLAEKLYDKKTGLLAAFILATAQGTFLMTNDVRCDTALMGWSIATTWFWFDALNTRKLSAILLGAVCAACGLMTKGPIGLIAPVLALGAWLITERKLNLLRNAKLLWALPTIILLLLPMSIGLYQQFDLHPEKFLNGRYGNSGLRFFYWTQSFGRITGENDWNNGADLSFQLVNMLWSFLPWIFLLVPALFWHARNLVRARFSAKDGREYLSFGGFVLCYLAVGLSKYQLPHYIFVAFPFAAICTAGYCNHIWGSEQASRAQKILHAVLVGVCCLLFVGMLLILTIVFPSNFWWIAAAAVCISVYFFILLRRNKEGRILLSAGVCMMLINIFLTHRFYNELMQFQIGSAVGKVLHREHIPAARVIAYRVGDPLPSMHFYAGGVVRRVEQKGYLPTRVSDYILTERGGLEELTQRGFRLQVIFTNRLFKVSELTGTFLNPTTRNQATRPYYLCKVLALGDVGAQ